MWSLTNRPTSAGRMVGEAFGIEDLQEMAEALGLGLQAERPCRLPASRGPASASLLNVTEYSPRSAPRRRSSGRHRALPHMMWSIVAVRKGSDGCARSARARGQPDVGRVVGPHRGRDVALVEQPLLEREHLAGSWRSSA